jgi:hypothetical protein
MKGARQMRAMAALLALSTTALSAAVDFSGVWLTERPVDTLLTDQGAIPPLLPEARQAYDKRVLARQRGDTSFDPTTQCQPPGLTRAFFMRMPIEIQQEDRYLYVNYQWNRLFRVIELGITHEQQNLYAPTYFGWGVGRWEADALVIDSVLFNDTTLLDAAGLPHSMDMHVIERWQLQDKGSRIAITVTIDDPQSYSAPWSFSTRLRRAPAGTEIQEDICLERLNLIRR